MRILHISSEPPGEKSGGQLVVKESIIALSKLGQVDYIGPSIESSPVMDYLHDKYFIKSNSKLKNLKGILTLNFSSYYTSFMKTISNIDLNKYDYIYLEFSKWLFAIRYAKKLNKKVAVRLHNIESDYSNNLYRIDKKIKNYLAYIYYTYIERKVIKFANDVIVLTEKDKVRLIELYGSQIRKKNIIVMPVCVEQKSINQHKINNNNINLLITGSLWYGPNYEGIMWFLDNVWKEVREFCSLYIVGANPNDELIKIISKDIKIILIENPKSTQKYFELADIYISPIFSGAGMKVKNAEAMSYGLPIIATKHSFIGYEKSNEIHSVGNSKTFFIEKIKSYKDKKENEIIEIRKRVLRDFINKYNLANAVDYLNIIEK